MSAAQLWLFVTDGGLAAWRWQAAQLQPIAAFTSDAAGRAAFDALAARYRKARWRLLLDLQDEDCRVDTVPHLGARDRHRLMERRLEANHPGLRYRSALTLGRDAHGRRDDRVLLAALTNPSALEAWLAILQAHDARLAGIASLAALTALHAHRLAGLPPCALLVSRQQGSGLRQSYLADGVLHFTRLTRTDDDRPAVLAALLGSETLRARQYLASQRLLEREQLLDVVLLCSEAEGAALRPHCADGTQIRYHFVALRPDAAMEAMPHASEAIWLQLAARHGLVNQYASPALRQTDLAARAARGYGSAACRSVCSAARSAVSNGRQRGNTRRRRPACPNAWPRPNGACPVRTRPPPRRTSCRRRRRMRSCATGRWPTIGRTCATTCGCCRGHSNKCRRPNSSNWTGKSTR
ncbi:hypothetical protein [Chitinimonas koreensis]|uniref:hypothetical protein n=1 Tax=Chitinimonas koreensis TaxID=356302 RepID=UPI0016546AC9|nr:hypothetical protein [Chitinimonas koreensis]QNM96327.1 hypothetical protein H9L41_21440 [Chitinimonas koreensis]